MSMRVLSKLFFCSIGATCCNPSCEKALGMMMLMMVGGSRRVFGVFFSSTLRFDLGHYENF